jgi:hypothetical protein
MSNQGPKKKKVEPPKSKKKHQRGTLAWLTLILAVTSFLVKEVLREPTKDIASAIKSAHESFDQNSNLTTHTAQTVTDSIRREGDSLKRGDITYDFAIQQSISDVRELRSALDNEFAATNKLVSALFLNTRLAEGVKNLEKDKRKQADEFCDNTVNDAYNISKPTDTRWLGLKLCQMSVGVHMVTLAVYSANVLGTAEWEERMLDRANLLLTIIASVSGLATILLAWYSTGKVNED